MKFATASIVLLATVCASSAEWPAGFGFGGWGAPGAGAFGGWGAPGAAGAPGAPGAAGPAAPAGWLIGQGASINAVNLAVNGALASNADSATLPPELQVTNRSFNSARTQLLFVQWQVCSSAEYRAFSGGTPKNPGRLGDCIGGLRRSAAHVDCVALQDLQVPRADQNQGAPAGVEAKSRCCRRRLRSL